MSTSVVIPLSKTKLIRNTTITALFFSIAVLIVVRPFWFIQSDNPRVIIIVGYILIAITGLALLVCLKKLTDKKPGLVVDEEGILDNSNGVAAGKIYWKDVKKITMEIVEGHPFVMVVVKNPNEYVQEQKNPLKRQLMELNARLYQTPLNITATGLKISCTALHDTLQRQFEIYKNR